MAFVQDCRSHPAQGDREARNLLGIAYRDGLGVERKAATALHLFSAAAGADLAEAHIQLGKMHASKSTSASPDLC